MSDHRPSITSKPANIILIVTFVVLICLPLLDNLLGLDPLPLSAENRDLTPMPELRLTKSSIETFPRQFESFFDDHFGFRNSLLRWQRVLRHKLLGSYFSPDVLIGKDGWLFCKTLGALDYYRNAAPLSHEQIRRWQRLLEARRDWLASHGIRHLVVFAPNKHAIYPEYLPQGINRLREESRMDQLADHLRANSDIEFLVMAQDMNKGKEVQGTYCRTDTHWNHYGRFLAYQKMITYLKKWFPVLPAHSYSDYEEQSTLIGGDLARMLGIVDYLREETVTLTVPNSQIYEVEPRGIFMKIPWKQVHLAPHVFEQDDPELPSMMLVGDSFGIGIFYFLAESFRRSVYINRVFDREMIETEKPDLVIEEMAESTLIFDLPQQVEELKQIVEF